MTPMDQPPSANCPSSPVDGPAVGMRRLLMLRRAPDYPAAHSMDTVWFAVDEAGHVAALWTGENGSLPTGLRHSDLLDELYRRTFQDNAEPHPDWDRFPAQALGVFAYHYSDGNTEAPPVDVYQRADLAAALHVDQLPPDFARRGSGSSFLASCSRRPPCCNRSSSSSAKRTTCTRRPTWPRTA